MDIVLLNLRTSMFGVNRVLADHDYEVEADKAMTRASKRILDCPEYEFLTKLKRSIHATLKAVALPGNILRPGIYPISVPMVEQTEKLLEDFAVRWQVGVMGLGQVWDLRSREVAEPLGALYDEGDYPSWEKVSRSFSVRWSYVEVTTPKILQAVSPRLYQRERAKGAEEWAAMLAEIRDGLRFAFKELVDALVDKLTPAPDGTRKKLVGVDRLIEFVNTFTAKNVADDAELLSLVQDVRGLLSGQDATQLRKDQGLREVVKERMESVKVVLDTLVEDAPTRQIVLRD
jgi:hypothetical protein